jgi:hypothetical protein
MKVAVVGSGASAISAITALLESNIPTSITVYDVGVEIGSPTKASHQENLLKDYDQIYEVIGRNLPRKFPPPKTHFGEAIERISLTDGESIYWNGYLGGLTNFWGGSMLPFTDRELSGWPLTRKILEPYYKRIAKLVGIAGQKDSLNDYLGEDYSNKPPISALEVLSRLDGISTFFDPGACTCYFGVNRCALETRPGLTRSCTYCGECMAGCLVGSLFNASDLLKEYRERGSIRYIKGRVRRLDDKTRDVEVEINGQIETHSGFSKVFLCGGCFGTTEILMRSFQITSSVRVADNAVLTVPLINIGTIDPEFEGDYFGLTNELGLIVPETFSDPVVQVQIYPNVDYLWRFNLSLPFWNKVRPVVQALRQRIFWGRIYLHSDLSQKYQLSLVQDRLEIKRQAPNHSSKQFSSNLKKVRTIFRRQKILTPILFQIREKTNSHYGGSFPFCAQPLSISSTGEVANQIYVCDSTTFPSMPAISPTFTIMANSYRIAWEAING